MSNCSNNTKRCLVIILSIFALFILLVPIDSSAQSRSTETNWRQARFALLPLANHSDIDSARQSVEHLIKTELETRCELVPPDSLRDYMRSERLRLVGGVNSVAALKLRDGLDVDYVITGAIELFQPGLLPEFSLCLRVYNCWDLEIVWLKCVSATGQDYSGVLNIGEISSLDKVVALVIEKILADFEERREGLHFTMPPRDGDAVDLLGDGTLAIIPCDHTTLYASADNVVTDLLTEKLWQQGYPVAEPGDVVRILTRGRELFFGAASDRGMAFLADSLNVSMIASGTVFEFTPLKGQISVAGPLVSMSLRLVDPGTGEVISATDDRRHGANVDSAFGAGREFTIGKTTQALIGEMWHRLVKQRRKVKTNQENNTHETVQR